MLILAKLVGILTLVWFYLTAQKQGESGIKWAIIGLIGYWVAWWLGNALILSSLSGMFTKSPVMVFLITQIPVVCGVGAAILVRNKLIKDTEQTSD